MFVSKHPNQPWNKKGRCSGNECFITKFCHGVGTVVCFTDVCNALCFNSFVKHFHSFNTNWMQVELATLQFIQHGNVAINNIFSFVTRT